MVKNIIEGKHVKGRRNTPPTTKRPIDPSAQNHKTWKPHDSDVYETYSKFYYDINKLLNKINRYWYADKAPNQSVRILRTLLKNHYSKRQAPLPEKKPK